jgi:hypothetical protein
MMLNLDEFDPGLFRQALSQSARRISRVQVDSDRVDPIHP